jgi:hypothetical protein
MATERNTPFNAVLHEEFLKLGFEYTHYEDSFEDDGDGESGPHLIGAPAYDEYRNERVYMIVDTEGKLIHCIKRDLEMEKFIDKNVGANWEE